MSSFARNIRDINESHRTIEVLFGAFELIMYFFVRADRTKILSIIGANVCVTFLALMPYAGPMSSLIMSIIGALGFMGLIVFLEALINRPLM